MNNVKYPTREHFPRYKKNLWKIDNTVYSYGVAFAKLYGNKIELLNSVINYSITTKKHVNYTCRTVFPHHSVIIVNKFST